MEKHYSLKETAEILGIKVRTVRDWIFKGKIKAGKYEDGKKWYIAKSEIERLQGNMAKVVDNRN